MKDGKVQVAIVSGADERFAPITDITFPTHDAYAERHGYTVFHSHYGAETKYPPSWLKIPAMWEALNQAFDWVFWIDADAMFMPDAPALPLHPINHPVQLAYQLLDDILFPSCGVMLLQQSTTAHRWLEELSRLRPAFLNHPWWEQAAAYRLMGYSPHVMGPWMGNPFRYPTLWTNRVGWLPRKWHSTPQDEVEGAYLLHATGGPTWPVDRRVAWLTDALSERYNACTTTQEATG